MTINTDKLNQTANGKGFTPNTDNKARRNAAKRTTSKADLCKQIRVSVEDFEAHCKHWSIAIDETYSPGQVAAILERFKVIDSPQHPDQSSPQPRSARYLQGVAPLQSSTGTIQEAIGSMAGYSTQSTQALATQREVIADRVADQMATLLDPDLFLQDVMERTVAKLNQRTVEIPNFFDISLELPPAPTLKQLPVATELPLP